MKIIIHGKPLSAAYQATKDIEPNLLKKITGDFFQTMGGNGKAEAVFPKYNKALVVETIFWQDKWYCLYTYVRTDVLDKAKRQSYFCLSLLREDNYACLTSGVLDLLEQTYQKHIEKQYISANEYLVADFSKDKDFAIVEEYITKSYVNLEDPIDNTFKREHSSQEVRCNVCDCDARTFIQTLKTYGRVIVGQGEDFLPALTATKAEEIKKDKEELSQRVQLLEEKINTLSKELTQKEERCISVSDKQVQSKQQITKLTQANEELRREIKELTEKGISESGEQTKLKQKIKQLVEENAHLQKAQDAYNTLLDKLHALLPSNSTSKQNNDTIEERSSQGNPKSLLQKIQKYIPFFLIFNTLLLFSIIIILFLLNNSPQKIPSNIDVASLQNTIDSLSKTMIDKETRITEQDNVISQLQSELSQAGSAGQNISDLNDSINKLNKSIKQLKTEINDNSANIEITLDSVKRSNEFAYKGDTLEIRIEWKKTKNYEWHVSNALSYNEQKEIKNQLNKAQQTVPINTKCSFKIQLRPKETNEPIILCYRSKDQEKTNFKNRIIIFKYE